MDHFRGKNVFVSGGAGVIGTSLVKKLHQAGARLLVGDLKAIPIDWPKDILYREGDLNTITSEEFHKFAPEYYFHLAATFERSTESPEFWKENDRHNIRLSHHLLDCLKDCKTLRRIVFASSYLIYDPKLYLFDQPQSKPISLNEESRICPRNLCGMAKYLHERELSFIQSFNRFSAISVRIFRGYGRNSRDVISRWVRDLIQGKSITLFQPEGIFDYIFADDSAEGLIRLAASDGAGVVNLGSGEGRSVSDVIRILKNHFPKSIVKEQQSDLPYEASQADITQLKKITGWTPQCKLEEGIADIIAFERNSYSG